VSAIDVDVQRRKPVLKTLGNKALGGQVIALIKFMAADDAEDAWITFQTRGVQLDLIQQMRDSGEPVLGIFEGHPSYDSMHFVAERQQVLCEVAAVLPGNPSNKCSLASHPKQGVDL